MKQCFKCQEIRPLSEFYKNAQMADGHLNKCKECTKMDTQRNYRSRPIEDRRAYERSRLHHPERVTMRETYQTRLQREQPSLFRSYKKKWASHNPHKRRAQRMVYNAVRNGELRKLPCERCGDSRSHGHHEDYSKPLDVTWLCPFHHAERHRELRDMGITL